MREKLVAPPEETIPQLATRCAAVSNRSARVSLSLEKAAGSRGAESTGQMKSVAGTVGDFVHEMDVLAALLEGTAALPESCRRHLEVLIADAEELAALTTSVLRNGTNTQPRQGLESAALEKLVQTEKTWKMMLQLVTSFQSLVQLQDEGDAAQVLEMTATDFDELERLISRVQVTEPSRRHSQAIASSSRRSTNSMSSPPLSPPPIEDRTGLPDYDSVVASPTIPSDSKEPMPVTLPRPVPPAAPSPVPGFDEIGESSSSATKPKLGPVSGFFRSLSQKLGSPVQPLVTPLCQAAAAGNIDQVRGLLIQGADIDGHNAEGYTSITSAIHSDGHKDQLQMVRFLLDSGAKLTTKDAIWSLPPLWHAARAGRADIVDLLVSRGADPKKRNTSGFPYFFDSVEKDPAHVIELLLRRGADPNVQNLSGKPAILTCVKRGDLTKVRTLLDAGAKITSKTPTGHSMLTVAINTKNSEMARFLLGYGAKPHGKDGYGNSHLSLAVENEDVEMATILLASGAFPNGTDIYGNPCLVTAVQKDNAALTALLLEHGADADAKDYTGRPVLATAVIQNKFAHAKLLLERGASVAIAGNRSGGAHLLTTLIKQSNPDKEAQAAFLRLLLRHGSNPDLQPGSWDKSTSHTPLGHCIKDGKLDLLRILLEHGADPHRSGQDETHALWDPLSKDTPFRYAVSLGKADAVRVLLDEGRAVARLRGTQIDVDSVILEAAATTGSREVVDILLDEGIEHPQKAVNLADGMTGAAALKAALEEKAIAMGVRARSQWLAGEVPPPYDGPQEMGVRDRKRLVKERRA